MFAVFVEQQSGSVAVSSGIPDVLGLFFVSRQFSVREFPSRQGPPLNPIVAKVHQLSPVHPIRPLSLVVLVPTVVSRRKQVFDISERVLRWKSLLSYESVLRFCYKSNPIRVCVS